MRKKIKSPLTLCFLTLIITLGIIYSCKEDVLTNDSINLNDMSDTTLPDYAIFPFIKGIDLSYANELEDLGVQFYEDSIVKDVYQKWIRPV